MTNLAERGDQGRFCVRSQCSQQVEGEFEAVQIGKKETSAAD